MNTVIFSIDESFEDYVNCRVDKFLAEQFSEFSRSYLQKIITVNQVTVEDRPVKANYKLKADDIIKIEIPDPEVLSVLPEDIPLDIYYEDEDLLIVNKPKGMVVHPAPGHTEHTLVNALMYHCKDSLSTINGVMRPGIVHRIDKDTTGLLVVCKSDRAHRAMAEKFAVHDIERVYTAITYNHFKDTDGTVDAPIGRSKSDRKKMAVVAGGRHAVTHFHVEENLSKNFSLITARLETGRTHQIRVHMSHIGHPLLGDPVYGPSSGPFRTDGQVLHAGTLGFVHPVTGEHLSFTAPLPEYFEELLKKLRG